MPAPRSRHDAYGRPLPTIAEVREDAPLLDREQNILVRQFVNYLLDMQYAQLLRRGIHAKVTLEFHVKDGFLADEILFDVRRRWSKEAG